MVHENKKCGFRFKNWRKNMDNAKVQWSGQINTEKKKLVKRKLSLGRLIESSEEQFNSASCDTSVFLVRQSEEYQWTLSMLLSLSQSSLSTTSSDAM